MPRFPGVAQPSLLCAKYGNFFVVDVYSDCMNVFWPINWQLIMIFIPLKLFFLIKIICFVKCMCSFLFIIYLNHFSKINLEPRNHLCFLNVLFFFASKDHSSINTRLTEWLDWLADKLRVVVTLLDCEIFWDRLDL